MTVTAPPPAGTLNVTWENMAPDTNTFQGDVNLSMLWLSLEAQGADITLYSIQVDVFGLPPQGIDRVFLWDDRNYDRDLSYDECVIGEEDTPPYILPPSGDMRECTGFLPGIPVVIEKTRSRYFSIMLDLYFDPLQTLTDTYLRVCVDAGYISSSATSVVGLPACSRTIDVNTRFFYDDMEHGQGNWTFSGGDDSGLYPDGLWHLTYPGEEDCINNIRDMSFSHSGNTSWYYGHRFLWWGDWVCNYYTGTRNWGRLTTPWIDARKGTSLAMTVFHFLSRELYNGVDLAEVYLHDGASWKLISSEWFTDDQWKKLVLNLSEYAGKQVKLEFRFDTVDTINNLFIGWMVDLSPAWEDTLTKTLYGNIDSELIQAMSDSGLDSTTKDTFLSSVFDILTTTAGVPGSANLGGFKAEFGGVPDPPNRYALLIGGCPFPGQPSDLLWNDLRDNYEILIDRGFPSDNIRLLTCVRTTDSRVDALSTRQNIIDAMDFLGDEMDNTDDNIFYLHVLAHGCTQSDPVCGFDGFIAARQGGRFNYDWATFASDLNSAIGFDQDAKYETAVMVISTCYSGVTISYLSEENGVQDMKRIIFASSRQDELTLGCVGNIPGTEWCLWTNIIFTLNFLNQLGYRVGTAFWWGFTVGFFTAILPMFYGAGSEAFNAFDFGMLRASGPNILFYFIMFVLEIALVAGIIAMLSVAWIDTKGDWMSSVSDITVWDAFKYAKGWTEYGLAFNILFSRHPQYFNEDLADEVDFGP